MSDFAEYDYNTNRALGPFTILWAGEHAANNSNNGLQQ